MQTIQKQLVADITELEDLSFAFVRIVDGGDEQQIDRLFSGILSALDKILDDLSKGQEKLISLRAYNLSPFQQALSGQFGQIKPNVSKEEQSMMLVKLGSVILPLTGERRNSSFQEILIKTKGKNKYKANFEVRGSRHAFIICSQKMNGSPDGLIEFQLLDFCSRCKVAARVM